MKKCDFLIVVLVQLPFLIQVTYQVFNINDFGAISNNHSYEAAIANGIAFHSALIAANSSTYDRFVLVEGGKFYDMLPADGDVTRLVNLTIQLDGKINLWDEDHSKYPRNKNGNVFNFISLSNSENLTIKGNGVIEGNGYSWWLYVIQTGEDNRPNIIDLSKSRNLFIDGILLLNSPVYHLSILDALNATIINVAIHVNLVYNKTSAATFPLNTGIS
jgi:polygalacturonase